MPDVNVSAHGTFIRFEARIDRLPSGTLQEPDQPRRGKHGWHLLIGKADYVLFFNRELHFADGADFWG